MTQKEPKEIKQPEQWYRLDLPELIDRKKNLKLSGYYKNLNVAIVIGENEGYEGEFKITGVMLTPRNKHAGITTDEKTVYLTDSEAAMETALRYASQSPKLTCAGKAVIAASKANKGVAIEN